MLRKELYAGSLKFRMNGKKLKGEFALVPYPWKRGKLLLLINTGINMLPRHR